ncbi:MAG: Rpn family recombination-promoting nuclease/putative transposase [Gammaproteobacteria bacterium]
MQLKPFKLIDLNEIEDKKLREQKLAGVMSMLMKHIHHSDLYHVLMSLVEEFRGWWKVSIQIILTIWYIT